MQVSVLILTYNEAKILPACLDSLKWCDEVVVLDSGSTDGTVDVAKGHGARVLVRKFDCFAEQRNFGLREGRFRHEWVLHLDADEILTDAFVEKLHAMDPPEGIDAYLIPSKTLLFERWLRYAGMYPTYQVRLGRLGKLRFKQIGHGQREDIAAERVAVFDEPYLHNAFVHGCLHWLRKHVNYARDEVDALIVARQNDGIPWRDFIDRDPTTRRRGGKQVAARLPLMLRPAARFSYVYFVRRGFLDGRAGLLYAFMLAVYEGMVAVLALERLACERLGKTRNIDY